MTTKSRKEEGGGNPTHGWILMEIIMSGWMNVEQIIMMDG
jgi:hypothetical protein